jgi:hypothetical protein
MQVPGALAVVHLRELGGNEQGVQQGAQRYGRHRPLLSSAQMSKHRRWRKITTTPVGDTISISVSPISIDSQQIVQSCSVRHGPTERVPEWKCGSRPPSVSERTR